MSSPSRWPWRSCGSSCGSSPAWAGPALPPPATPARWTPTRTRTRTARSPPSRSPAGTHQPGSAHPTHGCSTLPGTNTRHLQRHSGQHLLPTTYGQSPCTWPKVNRESHSSNCEGEKTMYKRRDRGTGQRFSRVWALGSRSNWWDIWSPHSSSCFMSPWAHSRDWVWSLWSLHVKQKSLFHCGERKKPKKGQLNPSTLSMQPTGNHTDKNLSGWKAGG